MATFRCFKTNREDSVPNVKWFTAICRKQKSSTCLKGSDKQYSRLLQCKSTFIWHRSLERTVPGSWQSAGSAPGTAIGAGKVSFVLKQQQQTAQVTRLLPACGIFSDLKWSSTKKRKFQSSTLVWSSSLAQGQDFRCFLQVFPLK